MLQLTSTILHDPIASESCKAFSKLLINIGNFQDLLTTAVAKYGWWLKSKEAFSVGSRAPTREITFKAMLLCSATCSIFLSSANLSGSLEKLLLASFAIL